MANDRFTYKIDEENAISIWDSTNPNEDGSPNLYQPWNPWTPKQPWTTKEEAESFAQEMIENLLNPPASVRPVDDESLDNNVIEVVPAE